MTSEHMFIHKHPIFFFHDLTEGRTFHFTSRLVICFVVLYNNVVAQCPCTFSQYCYRFIPQGLHFTDTFHTPPVSSTIDLLINSCSLSISTFLLPREAVSVLDIIFHFFCISCTFHFYNVLINLHVSFVIYNHGCKIYHVLVIKSMFI